VLRPERLSEPSGRGATGLLLATWALVACGSLAPPVPDEPEATARPAAPRLRSSRYGGPSDPVTLTDIERASALVAAGCRIDPRLVLAARAHARELSSSGGERTAADLDHLRFGILATGGTDYRFQPFISTVDEAGREALARFVRQRGSGWSHCGVGASGGVLVWIGVERAIEIDAVPIHPPAGQTQRITGRVLDSRIRRVEAFLGLPDGGVVRLHVRGGAGSFEIDVTPDRPGRNDLELLVDDGGGPEVAALLPLWIEVEPDRRPVVFQEPRATDQRLPGELLYGLIDEARRRSGLEPLSRDAALETLAGSHSADMAERGFFGHVSPSTGSLADRLAARGLRPAESAENVARSGSVWRAHRNLLQSPSHRMHLIEPRYTHLGVGVARDGDEVWVTEVFARW
jgi:hypothetical protein